VKKIAADRLYPFLHGVAVIKKGDATALIDAQGRVLVPYGKYKMHGPYPGGIIGAAAEGYGATGDGYLGYFLLNTRGQVIKKQRTKDGYCAVGNDGKIPFAYGAHYSNSLEPGTTNNIFLGHVAIDSTGFEIQLGEMLFPSYGEGLISFSTGTSSKGNLKIGFIKIY
jgi:hypothetical protein